MRTFKTVFMRGGTSKGCMFHKEDLPADRAEWDPSGVMTNGGPEHGFSRTHLYYGSGR
jgi:2-methylaconitate cis-trans-isomerase PrpF